MKKNLKKVLSGLLKVSFIILITSSYSGCNKQPQIQRLEIYYLHFMTSTMLPVDSCFKIFHYNHQDTLIVNSKVLKNLNSIIGNLEPAQNNFHHDFRIACLLIMENGDSNQLCLNTMGGIRYNKTNMKDSEELFYFFNNLLYNDSLSKHFWNKPK